MMNLLIVMGIIIIIVITILLNIKYYVREAFNYRKQLTDIYFWNFYNKKKELDNDFYNGKIEFYEFKKESDILTQKYKYNDDIFEFIKELKIFINHNDNYITNEKADEICAQKFNSFIWNIAKNKYYDIINKAAVKN